MIFQFSYYKFLTDFRQLVDFLKTTLTHKVKRHVTEPWSHVCFTSACKMKNIFWIVRKSTFESTLL